ncbi:unnamed protein product [Closterium sp. Naga37s-1]|nr:unnamed protein product [Closterium sp. Naga37s-1]
MSQTGDAAAHAVMHAFLPSACVRFAPPARRAAGGAECGEGAHGGLPAAGWHHSGGVGDLQPALPAQGALTCFSPAYHLLLTCFSHASHLLLTCFSPASHMPLTFPSHAPHLPLTCPSLTCPSLAPHLNLTSLCLPLTCGHYTVTSLPHRYLSLSCLQNKDTGDEPDVRDIIAAARQPLP